MSTKNQQKIIKLLDLLIFFVLTLTAIFLAGLVTRDQVVTVPAQMETREIVEEDEAPVPFWNTTNILLTEIRDILQDIRDQQITNEPELTLEGPDLYNSYVDSIVEIYYPDLDARYVKAIIYHESRYDPTITNSKTGVRGLMQISPKWHTQRAKNLGVDDLYDPYGNILTGCDLLNELTQKYSFEYAMNFFAGGYPYANRYKGKTSPYVDSLTRIIAQMESGELYLGGD